MHKAVFLSESDCSAEQTEVSKEVKNKDIAKPGSAGEECPKRGLEGAGAAEHRHDGMGVMLLVHGGQGDTSVRLT